MALAHGLKDYLGVARSLAIYRGRPSHARGLRRRYAGCVRPGDLVLDVGAHVGDRIAAFRALGARVVALEPNDLLFRLLEALHGRDPGVRLVKAAAGDRSGEATFRINRANPTVSTLSQSFVEQARDADGWREQAWDAETSVRMVRLDEIVAGEGAPAFVKIDVEGFEAAALSGLTHAPAALSFEITTMARAAGLEAFDRAAALGFDRFRFSEGESHGFSQAAWVAAAEMRRHLAEMPATVNSGDVYCLSPAFDRPLPD